METNQDDPDSTNEHNPPHMWPREPDEGEAEAVFPAVEDDAEKALEEPGYGHGV
jgi:hypothetical protein